MGARINHHGKGIEADEGRSAFSGWTHMVNLVTIRGECFMVDVGVSREKTSYDVTAPRMLIRLSSSEAAGRLVRWPCKTG